ncbi:TetR/AcrR family transcriptional regulator [uncultured Stenotrophomonas sp.]|uniref:TetR/AcrR family transcriptional regulator n=1 Tax=uncultured Stenotrophomonas sp. TaxID=165438 RepID=UPI0025FC46F5|nr:TetR/AcrR family transcriptional regulator [uncultured Stenotrophomonas sp.]
MSNRSPAADRVCEAAVAHFAIHGYDGASLNDIAASIGIRKASLYSHFASKDALYLQVLEDAMAIESAYVVQALAGAATAAGPGAVYMRAIARRYEESVHLRYLLRTVFLPPATYRDIIGRMYVQFLELVREGFLRQLRECSSTALSDDHAKRYGLTYIGIVESLYVEIVYEGPEPMKARRDAMWQVLMDSLQLRLSLPA